MELGDPDVEALLSALVLQLGAGAAAWFGTRQPRLTTLLGTGGAIAGCLLGLLPTLQVLLWGGSVSIRTTLDSLHGAFAVELDPLGAFFLLPVLLLGALTAVYGAEYMRTFRGKSLGPSWFFFNAFLAGMTLVVVARTVMVFLIAWEMMSLSAYCLVTFEHEKPEVRRAGWVYLVATHLGTAALLLGFLLLSGHAGGTEFTAFSDARVSEGWSALIFLLAVFGFGTKAGLVPLHVWLPDAHPAAPSHISALMSGVMIKMGFYGMLRVVSFLGPPAVWWGPTLAGLGLLTALVGIALAVNQRDIKRVLAYSSIENMGLIAIALGVGLWGWANHYPGLAFLGMTAGFLHLWNHALMKGLLFLSAGSIVHGTGTKDIEQLGGLLKRMPRTANAMLVGAVALAALPPLNGFVSKGLIYLSLLRCGLAPANPSGLAALLSVGLVAIVGGLGAIVFVRLIGIVLLGSPRSEAAQTAHESSWWMIGPIQCLAVLCLAAAVAPQLEVVLLQRPIDVVLGRGEAPPGSESTTALVGTFGWANVAVLMGVVAVAGLIWMVRRRREVGSTWGCGYARPTPRMQYTGGSFAQMMGGQLAPRALRSHVIRQGPQGLFPTAAEFRADCPDPVMGKVYVTFFRQWATRCTRLRLLQQGKIHIYLIYIACTVVLALAWVSVRAWWGKS
jgi:formate hydrogenlyase subunit 3/multisubunit Na+/H+ antiporter MnhD subunit